MNVEVEISGARACLHDRAAKIHCVIGFGDEEDGDGGVCCGDNVDHS